MSDSRFLTGNNANKKTIEYLKKKKINVEIYTQRKKLKNESEIVFQTSRSLKNSEFITHRPAL